MYMYTGNYIYLLKFKKIAPLYCLICNHSLILNLLQKEEILILESQIVRI